MVMRALRALATFAMVVSTAQAEPVKPPPSDEVVAKRLFEEGRVLYQQAKHIEACVLFRESYELDPAVGTRLNLAECAERQGKHRDAWLLWVSAAKEFEKQSDGRATFARRRADALAKNLATVIVRVARPRKKGLLIRINDYEVEPSAYIVERTDARRVVVTATAPNRKPFEAVVSVSIGSKVEVEIPPLERLPGEPQDDPDEDVEPSNGPWIPLAVGSTATFLAGTVLFIKWSGDANGQQDSERDASQLRANTAAVVAGVALVAAVAFAFKGASVQSTNRRARSAVVPVLAPTYAGLQVRW